jgi:hypothetical protein
MRTLPDPDLSLRDASDFIFDSALCRRALNNPQPPALAVLLREFISGIHRLTVSCHLPEFTDHGLGHLCSLIDRLSRWSAPGSGIVPKLVVDDLNEEECAVLLLATLLHDIGMLSQRPEDLPMGDPQAVAKPLRDIPTWVRRTHIPRMERVAQRLFADTDFASFFNEPLPSESIIKRAFTVAKAHGQWPWLWHPENYVGRDAGLAALVAVADLLDEDSARCDSATLLRHRFGSAENCAHWIRHGLTAGRVLVQAGSIVVRLARPPGTDLQFDPVFVALRNHFLLVRLYLPQLAQVGAEPLSVTFDPPVDGPLEYASELSGWEKLPDFRTQSALVFHLLGSFMPEALLDQRRVNASDMSILINQGLMPVGLANFYKVRGAENPRMAVEQSFLALLGDV